MTDTHTKEHSHAQVLRWIADGKRVRHGTAVCDPELLLEYISEGAEVDMFTLAPHTIKVGSREINAPLDTAPEVGSSVWLIDAYRDVQHFIWRGTSGDYNALNNGNVWATEADATVGRDAWRDLMMGGE